MVEVETGRRILIWRTFFPNRKWLCKVPDAIRMHTRACVLAGVEQRVLFTNCADGTLYAQLAGRIHSFAIEMAV